MSEKFKLIIIYFEYIRPDIIRLFFPLLFSIFLAGDAIDVALHGNEGIGSEGPFAESWWYRSRFSYVLHGIILITAVLFLPIISFFPKYFGQRRNIQRFGNISLVFLLLSHCIYFSMQ